MMRLKQIESVIFAVEHTKLIDWYTNTLGFEVESRVEGEYHYCVLRHSDGARLGIADAQEMSVNPQDRLNNSVVLQFQVPNVEHFLEHVKTHGGSITFGPSYDKNDEFWYGAFQDTEGNPFWVVDDNCP
jgi:predicted enzyme related to lactoylglutathione lyase